MYRMYATAKNVVRRANALITRGAIAFAVVAPWSLASAATITVNTNSAAPVAGQCALVDAIEAANFNNSVNGCAAGTAGADTIVFTNNVTVINFQAPLPGTIDALRIHEALTIDGSGGGYNGGGTVRIQRDPAAASNFRLFNAFDIGYLTTYTNNPTGPAVSYRNLEVASGRVTDVLALPLDPAHTKGGCIANFGTLSLQDVTVRDCGANPASGSTGIGGGIYAADDVSGTRVNLLSNASNNKGGGLFATKNVTLSRVSVRDNAVYGTNVQGGGLSVLGTLTLSDAAIEDNVAEATASGALGGGMWAGVLAMSNTTVRNNRVVALESGFGGGLYLFSPNATSTVDRTWIASNSVQAANAIGGGLMVDGTSATTRVTNSTINDNTVTSTRTATDVAKGYGRGGGLYVAGDIVIAHSTISGNAVPGGLGGGVFHWGTRTAAGDGNKIYNSTISGNSGLKGGGVYICDSNGGSVSLDFEVACTDASAMAVTIESSIVYGNPGFDLYSPLATPTSGANNIYNTSHNVVVTGSQTCNPQLAPLADNNAGTIFPSSTGVIPTRAISPTSCAVDQGNNVYGATTDQRGAPFARVRGAAADVGAFEAAPRPTVTLNSVIVGTPPDAGLFNLSVTGGNPAGGTNPANNVGNGGTTGAVSVDEATDITIIESAGTGTVAANYYNTFVCSNFQGPAVGTLWSFLIPAANGNAAENVTCTFSNRVKVTVSVGLTGTGSGGVGSNLRGVNTNRLIDCGATCSETFGAGIPITLTATPLAGSYFAGWSGGGCTGTGDCVVTPLAATTVTAQFNVLPRLTVTRSGAGIGNVRSDIAGIDCGASCTANFTVGTTVTLTATSLPGSNFVGWSGGACTGLGPCTVQMNAAQNVTAQFDPVQIPTLGAFGRVALPLLLALAAFAFSNVRRRA
ncbi:MAG TPA: choice-of-anchor Q domain-containing protein [Casimicrobium sp.]|nr:choice-of-anchor Q domain-containing protein [Casimicrobium sp.]